MLVTAGSPWPAGLKQAPAREPPRAVAMDEVPVRDLAASRCRDRRQDVGAGPGQQHRGRGAGAAGSDDDGVVRGATLRPGWGEGQTYRWMGSLPWRTPCQ